MKTDSIIMTNRDDNSVNGGVDVCSGSVYKVMEVVTLVFVVATSIVLMVMMVLVPMVVVEEEE